MQEILYTNKLSGKYLHYLILSGIIILTLIIYSGTFKNGFTNFDDDVHVVINKDIKSLNADNLLKMFSSTYVGSYQPIPNVTYALIYNFFGLSSKMYHATNLIFHLLNIILVYLFVYSLTRTQFTGDSPQTSRYRIQVAAFPACLFAIHPMNAECVNWVSVLEDVQYSFFYLASLIFYLKYIHKSTDHSPHTKEINQNSKIKSQKIIFYLLSLFLFILSLLSKSAAVTLPVVLVLLDYYKGGWKLEAGSWKYWLKKAPFFLLALVFGIITIIISQKFTNTDMTEYTFFNKIFIMTYSISYYIVNLIAPFKLSAIHTFPQIIKGFLPIKYYLSPLLIMLIIAAILKSKKTRNEVIFGILFFLFTISVTLIAGRVRNAEVAERYTYIPYLGFFYIIAMFVSQQSTFNSQQKKVTIQNIKVLIIIIIILSFSIMSFNRTKVWMNSLSLFNDVIAKYSRSYIAYSNRGTAKLDLGDKQGAIKDYDKAIEINPNYLYAINNRGRAKLEAGDKTGALKDYSKSIEINPHDARPFNNRGLMKLELDDKLGAIQDFNKAIEINPNYAQAFGNRGNAKASLGYMRGAILDYNKAIYINPKESHAYILRGNSKNALGDKQGAINDFNKAIDLNPNDGETYYSRGNAKASLGDIRGAIEDFNKAIELNPLNTKSFNNRGNAKAYLGNIEGALKDFNRAIEINSHNAEAINNRGNARYYLGDKEGACSDWRKASEFGQVKAQEMLKKYCH
jgi:protein O-mannosyl-transferase